MFDWLGFHVLAVLVVALVLGGMVFFAAFMTPMVFAKLPRETAGAFLAQVFPVYYQVMAVAAALAVVLAGMADLAQPIGANTMLLLLVALGFVGARYALLPRIERHREGARAGNPDAMRAFAQLHRRSVFLNFAQMVAVAVVLANMAR